LLGRIRNESSNEPQQEVTARNIFGLLCRFVTRLFHTVIYSGITRKKNPFAAEFDVAMYA
jgi:hypothetical protein